MSSSEIRWLTAASLWERLEALERCNCQPPCGLGAEPEDLAAVVQALGGAETARRWLARAGVSDRVIAAVLAPEGTNAAECVAQHVATLSWAKCAQDALEGLEVMEPRVLEPPQGTTLPLFPEISAQLVRQATRQVEVPSSTRVRRGFRQCSRAALVRTRQTHPAPARRRFPGVPGTVGAPISPEIRRLTNLRC